MTRKTVSRKDAEDYIAMSRAEARAVALDGPVVVTTSPALTAALESTPAGPGYVKRVAANLRSAQAQTPDLASQAPVNDQATATVKETRDMTTATKRCAGISKHGIAAHDNVPLSEFTKNKSHKDGLSNDCKACKAAYAQVRKGASSYEDNPQHDPAVTARNKQRLLSAAAVPGAVVIEEVETPEEVIDGTAAQAAEHAALEAKLAANGGAETDEGQAILAAAAAEAVERRRAYDRERKARARAAAKATKAGLTIVK